MHLTVAIRQSVLLVSDNFVRSCYQFLVRLVSKLANQNVRTGGGGGGVELSSDILAFLQLTPLPLKVLAF